jgi:hypothetical protein
MRLSSGIRRALFPLVLPLSIAFVAGCGSEDRTPERPGGRAGTIKIYTATYEDGRNEQQFFLKRTKRATLLRVEPDVTPGTEIEVWGRDQEDGMHVTDMRVDKTVSTVSEALINAMPYAPKKFAFVFVDIGGGINITKDEALKRMFGTNMGDNSVKQYYLEASYNTQDVSGDVYGPFKFTPSGCSTSTVATALKGMVPVSDHYLWYFGSRNASVDGLGWRKQGRSGGARRVSAGDTWYNASAGCVVLVQTGHNWLVALSSMTCGTASRRRAATACTHVEYGDKYDRWAAAAPHETPGGRYCRAG